MNEQPTPPNSPSPNTPSPSATQSSPVLTQPSGEGWLHRYGRSIGALRKAISTPEAVFLGLLCIASVFGLWWLATRGPAEERYVGPLTLPSIGETWEAFPDLWFKEGLTVQTGTTLWRVGLGFLMAIAVGVPLGVLAGCFTRIAAFLSPLVMFGRNIPLAAVLPLMIFLFHDGETRKIMFIFFACVAFVVSDTARAIADVGSRFIDTAYTLGASRWQTIIKVLVPSALPQICDSLRIMFGLAFGYIMLAESIKEADVEGGLGFLIQISQKRGYREQIYLIILIIPIVAFVVDRILFWLQRELFPHVYGGAGYLNKFVRFVLHGWDDLKRSIYRPPLPPAIAGKP